MEENLKNKKTVDEVIPWKGLIIFLFGFIGLSLIYTIIFTIFDAISVGVVIVCLTAIPVVENFRKIPSLQIFRSAEEAADTRVSPFDRSFFTIFAVNL